MKSLRPLLFALAAAALAAPVAAQTPADAEARVIVRFKPQADSVRAKRLSLRATRGEAREIAQTRATALGMRTGHALRAGLSLDERTHVVTARGMTAAQLVSKLSADAEVELVAIDGRRQALAVPNDPLFGGATVNPEGVTGGIPSRTIDQWYLKAPASATNPAVVSSINASGAWDLVAGGASVVVAVLDTGIRPDHPDFAGQLLPPALTGQTFAGYDMVGFSSAGTNQQTNSIGIANDGDGADLDASDPGDWITFSENNTKDGQFYHCAPDSNGGYPAVNSSWHGTRVAGLIAARSDNARGISGIGLNLLKILPVRVLGKCGGYDSDIIAGMKWAAGLDVPGIAANPNKAKVLNLSLGGGGSCGITETGRLYRDAIAEVNATGATIVVAAGNSEGQAVGLPGNCPGVVTVAALRHVGTKVGFSSIGPEVAIAAPGGNCVNIGSGQPCLYPMVSTTNRGTTTPSANDETYTNSNASVGTSFSAPVVSGIVGLMAALRPALTSAEATAVLKVTARAFPTSGGSAGIAACATPSTKVQDECYCTTSTCGAGMVDAQAAVAATKALSNVTVTITPSTPTFTVGQSGSLTAAITGLASGKSVTYTQWTLLSGNGVVSSFTGGLTPTATMTPTAAGTFTMQMDVTDSDGFVHSQTATITVAAAPVVTPPGTSGGSGGGGGGGSASLAWLASLLLAAFSLRKRPTLRRQRCKP